MDEAVRNPVADEGFGNRLRWYQFSIRRLLMLTSLVAFGCFLRFGNPQSCRLVYIIQAYVSPGNGAIRPPADYSGVWRTWYDHGRIRTEYKYENGRSLSGSVWDQEGNLVSHFGPTNVPGGFHTIRWDEEGRIWDLRLEMDGRAHGEWMIWQSQGSIMFYTYRDGELDGDWGIIEADGGRSIEGTYEKGVLVRGRPLETLE